MQWFEAAAKRFFSSQAEQKLESDKSFINSVVESVELEKGIFELETSLTTLTLFWARFATLSAPFLPRTNEITISTAVRRQFYFRSHREISTGANK